MFEFIAAITEEPELELRPEPVPFALESSAVAVVLACSLEAAYKLHEPWFGGS